MLRAIVVDDEELSINRLRRILTEIGGVEICRTFNNPMEAYAFAQANPIHLAFLDISMPDIDGMRFSSLLLDLNASIDVVFVTAHGEFAVQAFDMSALDYLMKPVTVQRVSKTLDKIRNKHRSGVIEPSMPHNDKLTEQETKVLRLIADGLSNKGIAYRLNITTETVKTHIKNVYRKLSVSSRVQALQRAKQFMILG